MSVARPTVHVLGALGPEGHPPRVAIDGRGRLATGAAPVPDGGHRVLEATGLSIEPGFVDLQVNGGFGHDLTTNPDRIWDVATGLAAHGVTAFLPTLTSASVEEARAADGVLAVGPPDGWAGAVPLGLHLEGPALAPEFRGAHPVDRLAEPDAGLVSAWLGLGSLRLVTLAPERRGALQAVSRLRAAGVVVAVGHTGAPAERIRAAADAGALMATHLFNAMAPFHHRDPGPVGAVLDDDRLAVGLIADGLHVAPDAVALARRAAGPDRIVLTGDAVAGLGTGSRASRIPGGVLTGGTAPFHEIRRVYLGAVGRSGPVRATAANACRVMGEVDRGTLRPGARGDLVLLDPGGRPVVTIVGGRVVYDPEGRLSRG